MARTRPLHPGVLALGMITIAFLAFALPPYLGLDPSQARLPAPEGIAWFYPMLVTHIGFGSVALLAACLQLSPWLRSHHPRVHRWSGRVYLFAGVLPAGVAVLTITAFSTSGPVTEVANTLLALLWLATSVAGYRAVRQRRFAAHREWMIRSVALSFSIVANRLWLVVSFAVFVPELFTGADVDPDRLLEAVGVASWLSWVVNLLIAEWWLGRTRARAGQASRRLATTTPAASTAAAIAAK